MPVRGFTLPVPGNDTLFLTGDVPRDPWVKRRGEVTQAVVAGHPSGTHLALQRVLSPSVQRLTAKGAIFPAVLASSTRRADRKTQSIFQTDDEVLARHGLRLLVFEENGHLTETPSTRTPSSS